MIISRLCVSRSRSPFVREEEPPHPDCAPGIGVFTLKIKHGEKHKHTHAHLCTRARACTHAEQEKEVWRQYWIPPGEPRCPGLSSNPRFRNSTPCRSFRRPSMGPAVQMSRLSRQAHAADNPRPLGSREPLAGGNRVTSHYLPFLGNGIRKLSNHVQ